MRGHAYIEAELEEISNSLQSANYAENDGRGFFANMAELFSRRQNLRPLLISLMLMFGQQMSGVNAVIFYRWVYVKCRNHMYY